MPSSGRCPEDIANTLTHVVGLAFAVVGAGVLIFIGASRGGASRIVGVSIFSTTLLLLYTASTLYHAASAQRIRARLRVVDHCAIYLLIAGTYTPILLVGLRGVWGWSLLGVIWGLALAGLICKLFVTGRFPRLSTAIYLGMGWLALVATGPMLQRLAPVTLVWILAGGLVYTIGTAFYHSRRLAYGHAVWHGFVMLGSACHWIAIATL
ncbi:MAG: hemolysin III family protein [Gemmatimonadota bacterium]|nr:MAG: hemolysin III family protein [Gemmatimonadota bacterium]